MNRKRQQMTAAEREPAGPAAPSSLLDHLWFRLLAAAWVLAIVLIYYRLQIMRLLQVLPR